MPSGHCKYSSLVCPFDLYTGLMRVDASNMVSDTTPPLLAEWQGAKLLHHQDLGDVQAHPGGHGAQQGDAQLGAHHGQLPEGLKAFGA